MRKNFLLLLIILFSFQHCGYIPIYSTDNNQNYNFHINIIDIKGDNEMNKIFMNNIKRFSKNSETESFDLNIKTFYKKNILTKNKKGKATSYLLTKEIEFEIISSSDVQKFKFEQETKTSDMISEFDLKRYESTIKSNFVNSKIEELIYKLSSLK